MKKLVFPLFLALLFTDLNAQVDLPKDKEGKVNFTEVVSVEGMNKKDLFANGVKFFDEFYKSSKVLQKEDQEKGYLEGQYFMGWDGIDGKVQYDVILRIKDGRYKYELTNFTHQNYDRGECSGAGLEREEPQCGGGGKMSGKKWEEIKENAKKDSEKLIEELKAIMQSKGEDDSEEDW